MINTTLILINVEIRGIFGSIPFHQLVRVWSHLLPILSATMAKSLAGAPDLAIAIDAFDIAANSIPMVVNPIHTPSDLLSLS
jgi:hypothetical protein